MAVTTEAETLTETHRRAQLALRAAVVDALIRIWPAFNPDELVGSWSTIEPALLALIAAGGHTSAGLAAAYYDEFRAAEQIAGRATPILAAPPPVEDAVRSLRFVGLVETRQLVDAGRIDAAEVAFTNVSGEMTRQVLNQGRDTLVASVEADGQALGWARVTDSNPCAFCRMLASRGPVYSQGGGFSAHGHCGCSVEPVYSHDQPWPGRAREFRDQWNQATEGLSGADARLAFRQHVEGRSN
jgi:hypothetical protein